MRLHSVCSKRILEMNITAKADFLISGKFVRPVFRNEFSPLPFLLAFTISPHRYLALSLKHPYRYDNFSRSMQSELHSRNFPRIFCSLLFSSPFSLSPLQVENCWKRRDAAPPFPATPTFLSIYRLRLRFGRNWCWKMIGLKS